MMKEVICVANKKFTNPINRGRIVANKFEVIDVTGNEKIIKDITNNVNVEGTKLNAAFFTELQKGLVFTVDTVHSVESGVDIYTLSLDGLSGASNTDGFPLFPGLSLNIKIDISNTETASKIRISGSDYTFLTENGNTYTALNVGSLIKNNYYKIIFNGNEFILSDTTKATETMPGTSQIATQTEVDNGLEDTKIVTSKKLKARLDSLLVSTTFVKKTDVATDTTAGICKYGTTTGTSLEGNQLSRILGIDDVFYGGTISKAGTKIAGKAYYDTNTKQIYLCRENNDLNYVDLDKFTAFSNKSLLDKLENLSKIKTQLISAPVTVTALYDTPKIYTYNLPVDKARVEYVKFTGLAIYSGTFSEIFSLFAKVDDSDEFQTFGISPERTSVAANIKLEVTNNQVKMTFKNLYQTLAVTVLQKLVVYHI